MKTKICKKCGRELSISEFYIHKEMSDGHLNFCKECVRARVHRHREENIERIREYERNRPNAKEMARKEREKIKNDSKRYERYYAQKNEWKKRNKEKGKAHNILRNALKSGKIFKSNKCEVCGKTNCDIQGHHYDYSKPLDVIWLCVECHGKVHKKYNKLNLDIKQIKENRVTAIGD